jgi:hypothetical protein
MWSTILVNLFIFLYLMFAVLWDSPELNLFHRMVRSRLKPIVHACGMTYAWTMYRSPFTAVSRAVTIHITYEDGTCQTLPHPGRYEVRRYLFMLATHRGHLSADRYLRIVTGRLLRVSGDIEKVEFTINVSPSPRRIGGLSGWFAALRAEDEAQITVACWTPE